MSDPSSAEPDGHDTELGREVADRQRPLRARRQGLVGSAIGAGPGMLGRRSRSFSLASGLSLSSRRALGMIVPDVAVDGLPVAPPAEWDESFMPRERIRTGDATLDHIIATQSGRGARAATPRRGLRSAITRRNTPTGRNTAPGASAHRLRPQSAPPALNPDVRRAVSGDGSDSRPRAPRSGPQAGSRTASPPGTRTGRHARNRSGRSDSWHPPHDAPPGVRLAERVGGPVPMSGRSSTSSLATALASWSVPNDRSPGVLASTPFVPSGPGASGPALTPSHWAGGSAGTDGRPVSPAGPLPVTPADLVAQIADGVVGHDGGATGWSLAGGAPLLTPSVRSPAHSTASTTPTEVARHAAERMAVRNEMAHAGATRGPIPGSAGAIVPAALASAPSAAPPARGQSLAPATLARPSDLSLAAATPGATSAAPLPTAAFQPSTAPGTASPDMASTVPSAGAGAMSSIASTVPSAGVGAMSSIASAVQPPVARAVEPALASMLRADPPAISLSSRPRRSFTPTPASVGGPEAGGARSPFASAATRPQGSLQRSEQPAGERARPAVVVPGRGRERTTDLPVAPGSPIVSASGELVAAPVSSHVAVRSDAPARGLGSVASLLTPSSTSGTMATRPAAAMPSPAAYGAASSPVGNGLGPNVDHASRASRPLTQLGSPSPAGVSMLAALTAPADPPSATSTAASMRGAPSSGASSTEAPSPVVAARPTTGPAPVLGRAAAPLATSGLGDPAAGSVAPSGTESSPVAPPPLPVDPGERFDQVLAAHAGPTLRRLPERFEPIARAILPRPGRVRLSTGEASRRALASVGKVAATSGDIVHLARPLDDSSRTIDILAHELTHVANPSPLVRFFDDDRDSHEERRAREVGSIMAKAPVGTPPASPPPAPPSNTSRPSSGSSSGSSNGQSTWTRATPSSTARPTSAPTIGNRPSPPTPPPAPQAGVGPEPGQVAGVDLERLLDALEARVIRELERRGRRWPRPM